MSTQGSMGLAILAGFLTFIALNSLVAVPFVCTPGANCLGGALAGATMDAYTPLYAGVFQALNPVQILLSIVACVVAGIIAGLIARGSAGRGFVAGMVSVIIGYYLVLLILVIYIYAALGPMAGAAMSAMFNTAAILPLVGVLLITPIIAGIIGGIGGAILGAILASPGGIPAGYAQPVSPVTTTIIQAPPMAAQPVVIQGQSSEKPAKTKVVICPACKAENEYGSTFCQSCGTRIK